VCFAEHEVRALRKPSGFDRRIGGPFAVSDDRNPLSLQLIGCFQAGIVEHLARKLVTTWKFRHMRRLRIQAGANYDAVENHSMCFSVAFKLDEPAGMRGFCFSQPDHSCVEANFRGNAKLLRKVTQVLLNHRAGREIGRVRRKRPIRKLVQFALHLCPKIQVTVRPDATEFRTALE